MSQEGTTAQGSGLLRRLRDTDVPNVAIYGIATGVAALLTLVLTRVLWRALSPDDFGWWSLIDPMLQPLASLVLLGADHAIVKQLRIDRLPLREIIGRLLASSLPACLVLLLATGLILGDVFHLRWTDALLMTIGGEALILIMQTAFRATGTAGAFALLLLARNLVYLAVLLLVAALVAPQRLALREVFLTRGGCVLALGFIAALTMKPPLRIDLARYADAVRYGLPLVLTVYPFCLVRHDGSMVAS